MSVDHLLIGAPELSIGCEYIQRLLGHRPVPGGVHPGKGTRNALLGLTNDIYIEVIAPDPLQSADLPLSRYLLNLEMVSLVWWAARCNRLDKLEDRLGRLGVTTADIQDGSRKMPDGRELTWRLLLADNEQLGATLPFFISWGDMKLHPARMLPVVGELSSIRITHRADTKLRSALGDFVEIRTGAVPQVCVEISQHNRSVSLCTPMDLPPGFGTIV